MSQDLSSQNENAAPKGLQRRQVLKGAAWAAPVVALTFAAPAQAASGIPAAGTLTLVAGSGVQSGGNIVWDGGTITYTAPSTPDAVNPAIVTYTVTAARANGGSTITLATGGATIPSGTTYDVPSATYPTAGLANGAWRITLTVTTSGTPSTATTANFSIANS